jgi:hypothetical protein
MTSPPPYGPDPAGPAETRKVVTHMLNRAGLRRSLAGLAGAALLLVTGAQATAEAVAQRTSPAVHEAGIQGAHTVELTSTADALTAPDAAAPGLTTFHATTTVEGKGWIGLVKLKEGVSWDNFRGILGRALSNTPSEVPQGAKDLDRAATMLGGAIIHPGQSGAFTQRLYPGTYLLFDFLAAGDAQPRYRWLTVGGSPGGRGLTPTATVVSRNVPGAGPRFEVAGTVRAGLPLRFVNEIPGQVNELIFVKIKQDATLADLKAYFDSMPDDGTFPPNSPFISAGLGSLPLSTGASSVVQVPLERTRYAVLTWVKDATDGIKLVKKGQFTIVEVK